MSGSPRCPVCRTPLTPDRTIEETWLPDDAAWDYRYACTSCLSIVVQRIPEISETRPRVAGSVPVVDISAGVVARVLARLRESAEGGRLADTVAALVEDAERRVLLRVPEIFAVARPGWGDVVRYRGARMRVVRVEETRFVLVSLEHADETEQIAPPDLVLPDLGSGA